MYPMARSCGLRRTCEIKVAAALFAAFLGMVTPLCAQDQDQDKGKEEGEPGKVVLSPEQEKARQLYRSIKWESGPTTADLGTIAEIKLPEGYQFTGREGGRIFEELNENPPSDSLLGIVKPADSLDWFIVFDYNETGYVKDDEKDKIDANAILSVIREGTERSNELRRSKGWSEVKNISWQYPPAYDSVSHNLVWATAFDVTGQRTVNYSTRILGRNGVINANLVVNPDHILRVVPTVKSLLAGLDYKSGLRYAEFRSGDKVAAYGLTALITGGAAAVAVKTGLLAKLGILLAKSGKLIIGGIVGLFALIFGNKKRAKE